MEKFDFCSVHLIKTEIKHTFKPTSKMYERLIYEFRYRNVSQSYITNIISTLLGDYGK